VSVEKFLGVGIDRKLWPSNSTSRQPSLISSDGLEAALGNCPWPNLKDSLHRGPRKKWRLFLEKHPFSKNYLF